MLRKAIIPILTFAVMAGAVLPARAIEDSAVSAPSAILMEADTGKILFERNAHEKRPCASITKVMTLLLVFEEMDAGRLGLDDMIVSSAHAASMGGSDIWLEEGETMTADDMIKATAVASANDAAVALAEHISGSEEAFVERMNKRAKALGMEDTTFKNCNGLDEEGHLTSAYDVALMSRELMKHRKIYDYTTIWLDYLRGGETQIVNTNKLLKTYKGITGLKTGTTDDAGCCMAASAERDGMTLVGVVLGCSSGKERFADAAALLDYGFANYSVKELKLPESFPGSIEIKSGMEKELPLSCDINAHAVVEKASADEANAEIKLPDEAEAPIEKGEKLGSVEYSVGGENLSFPITAAKGVEKTSFPLILGSLWDSMVRL